VLTVKLLFAVSVLVLILTVARLIYVLAVIPSRGDDDVIRKFRRERHGLVAFALLIGALIIFLDMYVRQISWNFLPPFLAIGCFFACYMIKLFRLQARIHKVFLAEPEKERRILPGIIFDHYKAQNPRLRRFNWKAQKTHMRVFLILIFLFPGSFLIWIAIRIFSSRFF
jgi:hypothetical protein